MLRATVFAATSASLVGTAVSDFRSHTWASSLHSRTTTVSMQQTQQQQQQPAPLAVRGEDKCEEQNAKNVFFKKLLSAMIPLIQKTPRHLGKSSPVIFGAVQPRSLSFCENLEDSMQRQKSLDDCNLRSVPIQAFGVDAQVQVSQATG